MKIVAVGCTHASELDIVIPSGDVLIHTGDYTGMNSFSELTRLNAWFGKQPHKIKLLCPGNHDEVYESAPALAKKMLSNAQVLIDEAITIRGLKFYGTPWQPYYNNWSFNVQDPKKRAALFKKIPKDTNVLITHCPPRTILDAGLGDPELAKRLDNLKHLKYHIFSHIHGAYGTLIKDGVTFVNCSILDDNYSVTNEPVVLEVNSAKSL